MDEITRREFAQTSLIGLAGLSLGAQSTAPAKKMIGIQVGAVSFIDEGVEPVLDNLERLASVNTLFIATFTYGRGIAGRQIPGQPLPDHGKQEYDTGYHGGNYTRIHPQYYKDTVFKDFRAPDHGDFDVLDAVLPSARKRGMKTICWFEDVFRNDLPNISKLQEKDLHGNNATTLCFNNPDYRGFLLGLSEDYVRSYDVDGIMWGSERQGAFSNSLSASHDGQFDPSRATCFCEFCQRKARERGISVDRAKEGFGALEKFIRSARGGTRPIDGYYVTLWRLMLHYPELLAWEMLWTDSLRDTYKAIYQRVKSVKPTAGVGWHIWHNNSFNPIYRAEQDLQEIAPYSDFLKIVIYHNCGGERLARYVDSVGHTMFGDVPKQELLDFHYRVMDYGAEGSMAQIPVTGLSADYVYRETKRARAGLAGQKTLLWPGIDIDIPTAATSSKSTPGGTKAAVEAAFRGGADGVLLSRKYSEMKLANLRGAGEAIRPATR
jgi:hypothetical protein